MNPQRLPCVKALDRECFRAHPHFARRALAYRLLHLLIPSDIAKLLPKKLSDPLVAPGVEVPLGAVFPPGTVLVPGCSFPVGWDPEDEPPECAKSAPLPTLAMQIAGGNPSVILSPGEPGTGQVHPPAGAPPVEHGSGTYYPSASGDDGEWVTGSWFDTASNYLYFGLRAGSKTHSFITYYSVLAPQASTILSAYLTFVAGASFANNPVDVVIYANDVDNPTNPTTLAQAEALVLTSASIAWDPAPWTVDNSYNSLDISTIIQEIVNRSGWAVGNNLMIVIKATDTSLYYRGPYAVDWKNPPALYIEW